jgi:predicted short-subunit dehydrogenase-like oxidoreductase (DUF2520 family)
VATAFGVLLERAQYHVVAAAGRKGSFQRAKEHLPFAAFATPADAARQAEVVVFGVPDDLIAQGCAAVAGEGAFREGQRVLHLSGAVGLAALDTATEAGADPLSLHPLQTIPDVATGIDRLPGSWIAVTARSEEAQGFGTKLCTDIGAKPFDLSDEVKPLYHAAAVFCSNYLVVVEGMAEQLFLLSGLPEPLPMLEPLARNAFEATVERGPAEALTGPAARGDVGTIRRNLQALRARVPEAVPAYVALARQAGRMAKASGRLDADGFDRLDRELSRWR